jgi:hypothetical protein
VLVRLGISLGAICLVASTAHAQSVTVTRASPPADKLAVFDLETTTIQSQVLTTYRRALARVVRKCQEPEGLVASMASNAVDLLHQKGASVSHLEFLKSMDTAMPGTASDTGVNCAEIAAGLVVMIGS